MSSGGDAKFATRRTITIYQTPELAEMLDSLVEMNCLGRVTGSVLNKWAKSPDGGRTLEMLREIGGFYEDD